jgi:hypothetical protein
LIIAPIAKEFNVPVSEVAAVLTITLHLGQGGFVERAPRSCRRDDRR